MLSREAHAAYVDILVALDPEVRTAVFGLASVGAVSAPFKDINGWHVIRMTAKNDARDQSYIKTVRSEGYVFSMAVTVVGEDG